jgi:hypothetical protein
VEWNRLRWITETLPVFVWGVGDVVGVLSDGAAQGEVVATAINGVFPVEAFEQFMQRREALPEFGEKKRRIRVRW